VGGEDEGARLVCGAGFGEVGVEACNHRGGGGYVEVREGFVEKQEIGVGEQDAGERGALAHALRVVGNAAGECGIEAYVAEGRDRVEGRGLRAQGSEVRQVFEAGEFVVEHGGVAHVGEAVADVQGLVVEDGNFAVGGCGKAGDELEEGGFSGAVFTEEHDAGACGQCKRDFAESGKVAEEARYAVENDDGFWSGGCGHACYASIER